MSNINILILASLAGLATFLGVLLGNFSQHTKKHITFSASFAACLMILISVFDLIPKALNGLEIEKLIIWVLAGLGIIWLINLLIPHLHSVREIKSCRNQCLVRMSYLVAIGLILHDFPEGLAIPSSFSNSQSLGFLVLLVTFVHNIPEGYILTLSQTNRDGKYFSYRTALLSALATFLGAILGINLLSYYAVLGPALLSLAAGAMLFIAGHELLPESFKYHERKNFLLGIILAGLIYFVLKISLFLF